MLRSRLDTLAASLDEEVDSPLHALAKLIEAEAQARVPVDEGDLKAAIHIEKVEDGSYLIIAGDDTAFYGHIVEFGGVGPGRQSQPFLIPAFEAVRDRADDLVAQYFKDL